MDDSAYKMVSVGTDSRTWRFVRHHQLSRALVMFIRTRMFGSVYSTVSGCIDMQNCVLYTNVHCKVKYAAIVHLRKRRDSRTTLTSY